MIKHVMVMMYGGNMFLFKDKKSAMETKNDGIMCWVLDRTFGIDLVRMNNYISNKVLIEKNQNQRNFIEVDIEKIEEVIKTLNWW